MPSPLAGEGGSAIAQQDGVRGRAATPHPIEHVATRALPSPARGEGKLANADCGHRPTPRCNDAFLGAAADIPSRPQKYFSRGETMAGEAEVQVSHFLDEHGVGAFQIKLILWSVLIAFIDGYDIGAIAFAAPSLIKEWHIAPKELGLVLSASNFGVLFGSQIFGWIGDRYGRKTALILANLLFGVLTYWAAYSTNLTELSVLRFIAGLGIGGVIPNIVAINAESAPRNRRATMAIIATGMVPLGGALAGFASFALVPTYGWQILFYIGGVAPIVFALVALYGLPESIKFMTLHEGHRAAERPLRHRGREAVAEQPDLSVRQRAGRDHAADLADVRLQPDGLFLPDQLDADADGRGACAAADRGAGRRGFAGRRHG